MSPEHHVIIVPGLGNDADRHIWATNSWKKFGITPHVFDAQWKVEEPDLYGKLTRALELVDQLANQGKTISLVGNSAGSSFVLNVFGERRDMIHRVIINCGRVRTGDWAWYTFKQATSSSPSFKESVIRSEKLTLELSKTEREKILTLRPIFDEVVPPLTVPVDGAKNEITPSIEHVVSIALNLTLFKRRLITFIQE